MTRTGELKHAIADARNAVSKAIAAAYMEWEQHPQAGEWSVRENAEHVVQNEAFFAGELAKLKSLPAPVVEQFPLPTPGAAIDALFAAATAVQPVLDSYEDGDLALEWAHGMSAGDLLELHASHAIDHISQIEKTINSCAVPAGSTQR